MMRYSKLSVTFAVVALLVGCSTDDARGTRATAAQEDALRSGVRGAWIDAGTSGDVHFFRFEADGTALLASGTVDFVPMKWELEGVNPAVLHVFGVRNGERELVSRGTVRLLEDDALEIALKPGELDPPAEPFRLVRIDRSEATSIAERRQRRNALLRSMQAW